MVTRARRQPVRHGARGAPNLATSLRALRQARNLSLGEAAKASGLSIPFLSLLERGRRWASLETLSRLAGALAIPVDVLILLASPHSFLSSGDPRVGPVIDSLRKLERAEREFRAVLKRLDP